MTFRNACFLMMLLLSLSVHAELVFDQEKIEHQASLADEQFEAVFTFTNEGKEPVRVVKVASSCGCTVPRMEKNLYQPGESGEIRAVFTFGQRTGEQHKRITVQTTGEGNRTHSLMLITRIPKWVEVQPRILRWKVNGASGPQTMLVDVPDPQAMEISEPSPAQHFTIQRQADEAGRQVFLITPKSVTARVTEFIKFTAIVRDGNNVRSREFGIHCLIR